MKRVRRRSRKHIHHRGGSAYHPSDMLMTFNRLMLIVVLGLVVVSGVTYASYVSGQDPVYNSPSLKTTTKSPNSCQDSDGGKVYGQLGTVNGMFEGKAYRYSDYCNVEGNLGEYYCVKDVAIKTVYACPNGQVCVQGMCLYGR